MFTGFTQDTIDFLWGVRFNNERNWFLEHKALYLECLYQPMTEFADELLIFLQEARPEAGLIRKVTRIYRDARRLFGRGPYKDHLWLSVERPGGEETGKPVFWFEVTPEGWNYGLGYWRATPLTMAKLRNKIDRDPETMEKLTRRLKRDGEFVLQTEEYRRPKAAPPSEILAPWYKAKTFALYHEEPWTETLYSREIVARVEKGFRFLLPYFDYFQTVEAEPDPDTRESIKQKVSLEHAEEENA